MTRAYISPTVNSVLGISFFVRETGGIGLAWFGCSWEDLGVSAVRNGSRWFLSSSPMGSTRVQYNQWHPFSDESPTSHEEIRHTSLPSNKRQAASTQKVPTTSFLVVVGGLVGGHPRRWDRSPTLRVWPWCPKERQAKASALCLQPGHPGAAPGTARRRSKRPGGSKDRRDWIS